MRYDIPAIEVVETTNDTAADEFKYITIRSPICKDERTEGETGPLVIGIELNKSEALEIRDNSVVTTQYVKCIPAFVPIPVNPPFDDAHKVIDDIDVPELGDDFADTEREHIINPAYEAETDRIIDAAELQIWWLNETKEPRFHTNLLEILGEKWRGNIGLPPLEAWDWFHVQTKPDQYTQMLLPEDPTNTGPLFNDYLITTSWYALNSILYDHDIVGPDSCCGGKIPRVAFVHTGRKNPGTGNTAIPNYYRNGLYINE
jgi:hypothetical protein